VILEKSEDLLGDIVGGVGRGRAGLDANPDDDGSHVNRRPLDSVCLDDVANPGTDNVPDLVQRGIKNSVGRLDGDLAESANRLGE